jgi:DNA-binding NtrC family response regulator/tetratricopeptide (TPR) repeat protein
MRTLALESRNSLGAVGPRLNQSNRLETALQEEHNTESPNFLKESVALDIEQLIREARQFVETERYEEAATVCLRILEIDHKHYEALVLLGGICVDQLGIPLRGRELLQLAIEVNPDAGPAYYYLGVCEAQAGNHERAIELLGEAIKRNFHVARAHYKCGNSYESLADRAWIKRDKSEATQFVRKAAANYIEALKLAPEFPPALVNLGSCCLKLNSHEKAIKYYNMALDIMPNDLLAWMGKLLVYVRKGDYERTLITLNEMSRWSGGWFSVQSHLQRCEGYIRDLLAAQKKRDDDKAIQDLKAPLADCAGSLEKLVRAVQEGLKPAADMQGAEETSGVGIPEPWVPDPRPLGREERNRLLAVKRKIDRQNRIVGESAVVLRVFERVNKLNQSDDSKPVVLLGETGVGKTFLVPCIVASSERSGKWEPVSGQRFAGDDFNIAKGELLGYAKGHGLQGVPVEGKDGLLQHCKGGTAFIDELLWLPREMQALLLTILDGTKFHKVGDLATGYQPKVRFIFATNRDPLEQVVRGNLLPELWRRISPYSITIPPLRERKEDIPLLARSMMGKRKIEPKALLALLLYDWPGNVGELDAVLSKIPKKKISGKTGGEADLLSLELPAEITNRVSKVTVGEAESEVAGLLLDQLKLRGFEHGKGLDQEVAKLLGVSRAKASGLLKQART